jgi:stage II sporulation protein D
MNYTSIFLSVSFLFSASLIDAKTKAKELQSDPLPSIKVLIRQDAPGALIEAKGSFSILNPENSKKLSSGSKGKRYYLHAMTDGIKWGEGFPGIYQILLKGEDKKDTFLVDGIEYEGSLTVFDIDEQISIINEIPVENYIKYALAEQFDGEHLDMKILKSLSIILRTQFYYQLTKNKDAFWQIDGSKTGFLGYSQSKIDRYIEEAVDSTKAVILTFNYRPFLAQWTANSAGSTASYPMIFRKNILSPSGVEAPYARKDKEKSLWTFSIQKNQLAQLVKTNRITAIDTYEDKNSGRIYALRIKDGIHSVDFDYFAFQKLLGPNLIKSNLFTVHLDKDQVKFEGYGDGHGVGLCLYSANEMAKKGATVEQILLDFFPNTLLQEVKKLDFSKDGLEDF